MDPELERQFGEELAALQTSGRNFAFTLVLSDAWCLFSLLQVWWRHPEVSAYPEIATFVRELAAQIEGRICRTPAMAEVARQGWDSAHDVPLVPRNSSK